MAIFALTDAKLYFDGYDLSGVSNQITLEATVDELDDTTFGTDGWRSKRGGLKVGALNATGFLDVAGDGTVDDVLFDNLNGSGTVISAAAVGDAGDIGYFFRAREMRYDHRATLGEMAGWDLNAMTRSAGGLVRGTVMVDASTAITATSASTVRQLGAVASGQKVYAALHVLAASGTSPTLDVIVESDDSAGFPSATTRLTFTQATGQTAEFLSLAGPITDTHWRVSYTVGGTDPSFTFAVLVGVQ